MQGDVDTIIETLRPKGSEKNRAGMARFGINSERALGVPMPVLRQLAREIRKRSNREKPRRADHKLALALWDSAVHEARILATLVDDPALVDDRQLERQVRDLDSWDVCDQACSNLFGHTALAWAKAREWSRREEEFVKRAGFVLMARLAFTERDLPDETFLDLLPIIARESGDERNFVKKAVNWALRQIGKRNPVLHRAAIEAAVSLSERDSRSARWIGRDALRELRDKKVRTRLQRT